MFINLLCVIGGAEPESEGKKYLGRAMDLPKGVVFIVFGVFYRHRTV